MTEVQSTDRHGADIDRTDEWAELRRVHLRPRHQRAESSARGVHHIALLSSDVTATIHFYQDLLEFPLTELFESTKTPPERVIRSISSTAIGPIARMQQANAPNARLMPRTRVVPVRASVLALPRCGRPASQALASGQRGAPPTE